MMETWAHGQDAADALGIVRPATDRLKHIAFLGVATFKWSFKNLGLWCRTSRCMCCWMVRRATSGRGGRKMPNIVFLDQPLISSRGDPTAKSRGYRAENRGKHCRNMDDNRSGAFAGPPENGPAPARKPMM
ncbi:MAG: hypothetical protein R2861_05685 [Desulfobacterales bacterium]